MTSKEEAAVKLSQYLHETAEDSTKNFGQDTTLLHLRADMFKYWRQAPKVSKGIHLEIQDSSANTFVEKEKQNILN